jgi:hypothetical protein
VRCELRQETRLAAISWPHRPNNSLLHLSLLAQRADVNSTPAADKTKMMENRIILLTELVSPFQKYQGCTYSYSWFGSQTGPYKAAR